MNKKIDNYLNQGCGRCPLGGTPECKVHFWTNELKLLREIVLSCNLKEELKWSVPCYTFKGRNILLVSAFKAYSAVSFFKGSLLENQSMVLEKPGENSQATRMLKSTNIESIKNSVDDLKKYIQNTIEVEKKGMKVIFKKTLEPIPLELEEKFDTNPAFKAAFYALTSGKQRGYILYFSSPKQSIPRISRIEKCTPKIFKGEGLNDNYRMRK